MSQTRGRQIPTLTLRRLQAPQPVRDFRCGRIDFLFADDEAVIFRRCVAKRLLFFAFLCEKGDASARSNAIGYLLESSKHDSLWSDQRAKIAIFRIPSVVVMLWVELLVRYQTLEHVELLLLYF